ncbi:MAG: prolipoprotein diacylglyceryl transferase family protein [Pedobacter sp.]
MNFPILVEFFGERFHLHYLFEVLAFFIGIRVYYCLKRHTVDPISDDNRLWIMLGAMVGALIGSRVIALLENPQDLTRLSFSLIYESKTIVGGLLFGLFGVELIKKAIGVKIASGDLYVVPIIVALFIGRIGCFSMGIAEPVYGVETNFFMGMDLGDGLQRHPVILYEMIYLVLLLLLFHLIRKKEMLNGDRFKFFMLLYFLFRLLVEFIKPYHPLFLNLSSIHWSAMFILLYYYKFILRVTKYS